MGKLQCEPAEATKANLMEHAARQRTSTGTQRPIASGQYTQRPCARLNGIPPLLPAQVLENKTVSQSHPSTPARLTQNSGLISCGASTLGGAAAASQLFATAAYSAIRPYVASPARISFPPDMQHRTTLKIPQTRYEDQPHHQGALRREPADVDGLVCHGKHDHGSVELRAISMRMVLRHALI